MTAAPPSRWNAPALLAPMLLLATLMAWRARQRALALLAAVGLAALVLNALFGRELPQRWLYLGQHVAIHLALASLFGATLRRGSQALISSLARHVQGELSPAMAHYTRQVTLAWTLYFIAMALLSIALSLFTPFEVWAGFANWLTPLAVAMMFGAEHGLRYRLHPEFERITVLQAVAAYLRRSSATAAAASEDRGLAPP